jgi:CubicO group peptidase (beta-lactamase class C family)
VTFSKYYNPLFLIIVLCILLVQNCKKNSAPVENYLFPEAEKQNIDVTQLIQAFDNASQIEDLQGLTIARNNVIVAEKYFNKAGPEPDPNLHVMSVTKSITATLVGIAIEKGYLESVDQKVSDFLPDESEMMNPALGQVTIRNLLTMTCGHDWHEIGTSSEFMNFVNATNQVNYIFQKPIINTPGTVFNYSDGGAHLVSVILTKATGMSTSEFANTYLFNPMGIGNKTWYTDKQGYSYGGVRLCIGNYDMAEIGFLYLNDGYYNDQQIVSSAWIDSATSFKISTNNIIPFLSDYGYFWWLGSAYNHGFFCANGYGGQFILVVRDLNLVVSSRTDYRVSESKAGENWYNVLNIIVNQILPAVNP